MIQEKVKTYEALAGSRNLCNNICLSFCLKSLWFLLNLRSYLGCSTNRLQFLINVCLPYSSIKPTLSLYLLFYNLFSSRRDFSPSNFPVLINADMWPPMWLSLAGWNAKYDVCFRTQSPRNRDDAVPGPPSGRLLRMFLLKTVQRFHSVIIKWIRVHIGTENEKPFRALSGRVVAFSWRHQKLSSIMWTSSETLERRK